MALSQSVASELLEAFRAGEGVDLIRESVRLVMQELIETEAVEHIGAGRYERTESRVTDRNGSRPRLIATQAGDIELRIPKLRNGSFFPAILEPRRRIDQALYAVVMEAYVNGVSTRGRRLSHRARRGIGHLEVGGEPDLRRPGRAGRGIPQPAAAPHHLPVCVP
jgi:putative transposase